MIKRSTRARLGHLSLILLGLAGGLAYLGAITRPATVGAVPIQQTDPQIGFTSTSFTVVENQGPAVIQVQINRTPDAGETIVVEYLTLPGTAIPGQDYTTTTGQLTFSNSTQTTQSFNVPIINNATSNQTNRTVNLVLRLVSGEATLATGQATLTITDDDPTPTPTIRPTAATGTPIFVDLSEPNDTLEEAYEVQPDAAAICQLTLWPPGDLDFYRFAVKSGTFYQLTTSDLSPGIDTCLLYPSPRPRDRTRYRMPSSA